MYNDEFEKDNKLYKKEINNLFDKKLFDDKKEIIIRMGKLPLVYNLYEGNIIDTDIFIHKSTINHFLRKHKYIDKDIILNLYEYIVNPLCLFYGSEPNTILSILDYKNSDNYHLQTPIFLNYKNNNIYINAIGTLYQQKSLKNYIGKEILKHNLIAYNKKIETYIHSLGLLLSVEEDKFSIYDDTITYTLENVKNYNFAAYYNFNTTNKFFKPIYRCSKKDLLVAMKELNIDVNKCFNIERMIPNINSDDYIKNIMLLHNKLIENKIKEIDAFKNNLL